MHIDLTQIRTQKSFSDIHREAKEFKQEIECGRVIPSRFTTSPEVAAKSGNLFKLTNVPRGT